VFKMLTFLLYSILPSPFSFFGRVATAELFFNSEFISQINFKQLILASRKQKTEGLSVN